MKIIEKQLIALIKKETTITAVAKNLGVSSPTIYAWLAKYNEDGLLGLIDDSPGPKSGKARNRTTSEIEKLVVNYLKDYPLYYNYHRKHTGLAMQGLAPLKGLIISLSSSRSVNLSMQQYKIFCKKYLDIYVKVYYNERVNLKKEKNMKTKKKLPKGVKNLGILNKEQFVELLKKYKGDLSDFHYILPIQIVLSEDDLTSSMNIRLGWGRISAFVIYSGKVSSIDLQDAMFAAPPIVMATVEYDHFDARGWLDGVCRGFFYRPSSIYLYYRDEGMAESMQSREVQLYRQSNDWKERGNSPGFLSSAFFAKFLN